MSPANNEPSYAQTAIRERGQWLTQELAKLKRHPGEDSIHDTRVQSRRMRAALESFQDLSPPREWQGLYECVRQITRALGEIRETEVIRYLLDGLPLVGNATERLCREHLDEKLEQKLLKLKKKVKPRLRNIDSRSLRSRIEHLRASIATPSEDDSVRALRILSGLAQPILEFRTRYFPRATDVRLHRLRIAAKKLRYAMEIFDPAWQGGLQEQIVMARALQDAAGTHQDLAVLKLFLMDEIRRHTAGHRPLLASGTERLLAAVEERKAEIRRTILPAVTELQTGLRYLLNR